MPHYALRADVPAPLPGLRPGPHDFHLSADTEPAARLDLARVLSALAGAHGAVLPEASAIAAAAVVASPAAIGAPPPAEWPEWVPVGVPGAPIAPRAAYVPYRTRYLADADEPGAVLVVIAPGSVGDPVLDSARIPGPWERDVALRGRLLAARLRDEARRGSPFVKRARPDGAGYEAPARPPDAPTAR